MPKIEKHAQGTLCWADLATTDPEGAKKFYQALFGWTHQDDPMGDQGNYTRFKKGDGDVCAAFPQRPEEKQMGIPPHWNTYVAVENVDAVAPKATSLGGKVLMEAFDVFDAGRMAVVQDPTGGVLCLWQAKQHIGATVKEEPATLCWAELMTNNVDAAGKFYVNLLPWKAEPDQGGYTVFKVNGQSAAGMMAFPPPMAKVPPFWGIYFAVEDCDASVKKATSLGAKTVVPPTEVPHVGRFAVLADPQGAGFAVIKLQR